MLISFARSNEGSVGNLVCWGRFDHHAVTNLSSKMMANWVFAATHLRGCIFHA
jgi:hypothetical protein